MRCDCLGASERGRAVTPAALRCAVPSCPPVQVKNPWPNVDAHSGVLLQYYGMTGEGRGAGI